MAIMRTNRLTSKTTPPQNKIQTTKDVTVSKKSRPMGMSLGPSGEIKAKNATLTSAEWDAEKSNKEYNDAMKRGEAVSINDPSIDPLTRKLVMGSFGSTSGPGSKDVFGDIEDITVPKGYKATSYKDIYGSDFNPDEFRGAAKAGKLDQYMKDKGYKEGQSWSPNFGSYTKYKTKPPVSEKAPMEKMPVGKAKLTLPKGKLKVTEKEEYAFNPATRGTKTKTKTSAAMTGGGDKLVRAKNPSGSLGAARVTTEKKKATSGYNREKALFEAKAGTSVSGRDFSNMSASEIKSKRAELKQDRRDYRKSSLDYNVKAPSIKEATMDIRQARKAETYTRKAEAGKLSHFTPGYRKDESKQGVNRIEAFKGSVDNATNRNTMKAKIDAISSKNSNKTNIY